MRAAIAANAGVAALCAGGVLLVANGWLALGVVLLVAGGAGALYTVPFLLLSWLYHRGEKPVRDAPR